jgi:hypothetical protein
MTLSDETGHSETTTATEQAAITSACPHLEAAGKRWGDLISPDRQAELQGYLDRWKAETDHGERKGPFENESEVVTAQVAGADVELRRVGGDGKCQLTGADVSWIVKQSPVSGVGWILNLHLEGADLFGAHLEGASLSNAFLEGANLTGAHMEHAELDSAHLQGADLTPFTILRLLNEGKLIGTYFGTREGWRMRRGDVEAIHGRLPGQEQATK